MGGGSGTPTDFAKIGGGEYGYGSTGPTNLVQEGKLDQWGNPAIEGY